MTDAKSLLNEDSLSSFLPFPWRVFTWKFSLAAMCVYDLITDTVEFTSLSETL